jgi:hypothetical protein
MLWDFGAYGFLATNMRRAIPTALPALASKENRFPYYAGYISSICAAKAWAKSLLPLATEAEKSVPENMKMIAIAPTRIRR